MHVTRVLPAASPRPASRHPPRGYGHKNRQEAPAPLWGFLPLGAARFPAALHGAVVWLTNAPRTAGQSGVLVMGLGECHWVRQYFTTARTEGKRADTNLQHTCSLGSRPCSYPFSDFLPWKKKKKSVLRNKHHKAIHYRRFLFICLLSRYIRPA